MNLNIKYIYIALMYRGHISNAYKLKTNKGEPVVVVILGTGKVDAHYNTYYDFPFDWNRDIKVINSLESTLL